MNVKPILFSGPMVRALLAGTKTQTRRVMKPQPVHVSESPVGAAADWSPYGKPGDLLWVRESFQPLFSDGWDEGRNPDGYGDRVNYKTGEGYTPNYVADGGVAEFINSDDELSQRVWPSIHMPRWASRLTLRITEVRVQRLKEISEADARAEGARLAAAAEARGLTHRTEFSGIWAEINGTESWDANPYVWALTFEVIKANIDQVLAQEA